MAIIESWYFDDKKLFSLPHEREATLTRGKSARGGKEKICIKDEDTLVLRRYPPHAKAAYTINSPSFITDVDELLRLRQLPKYIHRSKNTKKKPSEQELYQDAINMGGGISARRLGRLHSKITWQTSLHREPVHVADRLIWRYPSQISAWASKARTIFQI